MTTITIIMIAVALVEIIGFIVALIMLETKLNELKLEREKFSKGVLDVIKPFLDNVKTMEDNHNKFTKIVADLSNAQIERYEVMNKNYYALNKQFETMNDHYSKLLHAWGEIEERYSDVYEQIDNLRKSFEKLEKTIVFNSNTFWKNNKIYLSKIKSTDANDPWPDEAPGANNDDEFEEFYPDITEV